MMQNKLRLGILTDFLDIPAWAYRSLERIIQSNAVEFVLFILNASASANEVSVTRKGENDGVIYRLFSKIDEKVFSRFPSPFIRRSISGMFPVLEVITARPIQHGDLIEIAPEEIDKIKEYDLDIIFQLGFSSLKSANFNASKYGVWYYVHSDDRLVRGRPAGYWEVVEKIPETGVVLKSTTGHQNETKALYRSWYFTYPFSPARNKHALYWSASVILPRQVEALYRLGEKEFFAEIEKFNQELNIYTHKFYTIPSNFSAFKHFFQLLSRIGKEITQRIFFLPTWYLMFHLGGDLELMLSDFIPMIPPKDRYWADPHVVFWGGSYYVFIEEYMYKTGIGHISVIEINQDGSYQDLVRVLEKDYHLSYPFVFEWQGKFFMIPESANNKSIDLYECIEFPNQWEFRIHLMENVKARDTTLFYNQGYWWLFTALSEEEGSVMPSELFLFYSQDLFTSKWNSHPCNPIVSDIRKARPAGKLFTQDGKIYRPSQFISKTYGYGVDLNEVSVLSEFAYSEKEVVSIRPSWDKKALATHTFSEIGQITIIDVFTQRSKFTW